MPSLSLSQGLRSGSSLLKNPNRISDLVSWDITSIGNSGTPIGSSVYSASQISLNRNVTPSAQKTLIGWDIPTSSVVTSVASSVNDSSVIVSSTLLSNLDMGGGLTPSSNSTAWGGTGWVAGGTSAIANASVNNDHFNFRIKASDTERLTVNGVSRLVIQISASGPSMWSLLYSPTAQTNAAFAAPAKIYGPLTVTVPASSTTTTDITTQLSAAMAADPVTIEPGSTAFFRLVGYGGTNAAGSGRIVSSNVGTPPDFGILGVSTTAFGAFSDTGLRWRTNATTTTLGDALTANDFFSWSVTPNSGKQISIKGVGSGTFSAVAGGPTKLALLYSSSPLWTTYRTISTNINIPTTPTDLATQLSGDLATNPITLPGSGATDGYIGYFRLVYWGATSATTFATWSNLGVKDFLLFGATSSVAGCTDTVAKLLMYGTAPFEQRTLSPIGYAPYGKETYQYGDEVVRFDGSAWIYSNATYGELVRVYSVVDRPWLVPWPSPYFAKRLCP